MLALLVMCLYPAAGKKARARENKRASQSCYSSQLQLSSSCFTSSVGQSQMACHVYYHFLSCSVSLHYFPYTKQYSHGKLGRCSCFGFKWKKIVTYTFPESGILHYQPFLFLYAVARTVWVQSRFYAAIQCSVDLPENTCRILGVKLV